MVSWRNLFEVPQAVAEQMVAEGLLKDRELGALASPVFFLNEATQKQVCVCADAHCQVPPGYFARCCVQPGCCPGVAAS